MNRILVTGASRGLGLEFVRQYAAEGAEVIATCRDPLSATELTTLAARSDGRIRVERLDVTDHAAVDALAARYRGVPVDILINNAGDIGPRDPGGSRLREQIFGTLNYAEWRRVLDVNTLAPVKVAEAFTEHVAASRGRRMVFVSSTTGSNAAGLYNIVAYCSSKAALNKVVGLVARELRPRGIVAIAVCPGHVKTELGGEGAVLEATESISGLRQVIAGLTPASSGSFLSYDGSVIPW
jgi:NAD(P)-dependent dehydrogenase (short-subunit alcohol dehydrogenase family)